VDPGEQHARRPTQHDPRGRLPRRQRGPWSVHRVLPAPGPSEMRMLGTVEVQDGWTAAAGGVDGVSPGDRAVGIDRGGVPRPAVGGALAVEQDDGSLADVQQGASRAVQLCPKGAHRRRRTAGWCPTRRRRGRARSGPLRCVRGSAPARPEGCSGVRRQSRSSAVRVPASACTSSRPSQSARVGTGKTLRVSWDHRSCPSPASRTVIVRPNREDAPALLAGASAYRNGRSSDRSDPGPAVAATVLPPRAGARRRDLPRRPAPADIHGAGHRADPELTG
jgi:hypothetical protein